MDVFDELMRREPVFHRPEWGTTRADFEAMTHGGFWEVGASGKVYGRAVVLDELEKRHAVPVTEDWTVEDAACRALGGDAWLFTYLLIQGGRRTRRASIWIRTQSGWQIAYHQGTVITSWRLARAPS